MGCTWCWEKTDEVNCRIQRNATAEPLVVHIDHLKEYHAEELPESWIPQEEPLYGKPEKETQTQNLSASDNELEEDEPGLQPEPEQEPLRLNETTAPPVQGDLKTL